MKPTGLALLVALIAACGGSSRFALRPPVLRDGDDEPLEHAPVKDDESEIANAVDLLLLRPVSQVFTADRAKEARNVNALDEVADSTWFTNRSVTPEDLVRGTCPDAGPVPPFTIKTSKIGGVTPGFVVLDARGQKYLLKLDELASYGQPEISTAADAVVSRLYWAVGFNVPCNDVISVTAADIRIDARSEVISDTGRHRPFTTQRLAEMLGHATRTPDGRIRMTASRFIDGKGVGVWRAEGTRSDDPNDVIPHEDRREPRGEMFLAGWVAHWDSRDQNTYDTFVPARGGGGYVRHYFLDFSDAIGGTITHTKWPEPRSGYESVLSLSTIAVDAAAFGFMRRPWDEVRVDPRYPNLGYLDVEHFDPLRFSPQVPFIRWERAQPQDLAWMARRIARLGLDHVRAAVRAGQLTHPEEEARLVEILMGRRERLLRVSFALVSPLADLKLIGGYLCATDLARTSGVSSAAATSYAAELRAGEELQISTPPLVTRTPQGLCAQLPSHFAPPNAPRDSPDRYATIDLIRDETGAGSTRLRAHLYDLGAQGFFLAGIERE